MEYYSGSTNVLAGFLCFVLIGVLYTYPLRDIAEEYPKSACIIQAVATFLAFGYTS